MTQTSLAAGVPGQPRPCPACGGPLPGPVGRCPRCGSIITVDGKAKRSSSTLVIILVAVALLGVLPCVGILAAIAIPNFIRYQLRAKASGTPVQLTELVKAEQQAMSRDGRYLALGPLPAGDPGPAKLALSAEDLQLASRIDWMMEPTTYAQFRVAVAEDDSGGQAASFCAESDIDGDGTRAVYVAFLPVEAGAPPAPCTDPVHYEGQDAGKVIQLSGPNVF